MCYIFPHVPKCGGTSLLKALQGSGLKLYIDYDCWVEPGMARRNREAALLDFSPFDVVYGHFPIERYQSPKYSYIALVRDPVDRCRSAYDWHRDFKGAPRSYDGLIAGRIREGMTFPQYLRHVQNIDRVYRHFLASWPSEAFALIGRTERHDAFMGELSELLGVTLSMEHERKAEAPLELTAAERFEARSILAAEYAWFDRFLSRGRGLKIA